jgi:Ca2+/Na+ antiporter
MPTEEGGAPAEPAHDHHANNCGVPWYGDPVGLLTPESIALYLVALIWLLYGIKIVSEDYFAESINGLVRRYKIPHSVAGSTLMAVGASTPELLASFIGTFIAAESATGAGTVIGSIIFNHTCIIGGSILVAPGQILHIPLVDSLRDLIFYAAAIIGFVVAFADEKVTAVESWCLFGSYIVYILACASWSRVEPSMWRLFKDPRGSPHHTVPMQEIHVPSFTHEQHQNVPMEEISAHVPPPGADTAQHAGLCLQRAEMKSTLKTSSSNQSLVSNESFEFRRQVTANISFDSLATLPFSAQRTAPRANREVTASNTFDSVTSVAGLLGHNDGHDEGPPKVFRNPYEHACHVWQNGTLYAKVSFMFESFWIVVAWLSLSWFRNNGWFFTGFVFGFGWLMLQCVYLTYWLEKSACVVGITPGAMGTIFGAAGTSIPNLLCSLYVSREGKAVMAAGEVWGSQVWLVFVCLGLPWGIYSSLTGKDVSVHGSTSLSIWMVLIYLLFITQCFLQAWKIGKWSGYFYIFVYIVFVIFIFCNEAFHFAS